MIVDDGLVIAVAAHKPYPMPKDSCYLPLYVGASLHQDVAAAMEAQGFIRDDAGDSISIHNAELCELTALWWVWRNVDAGYKGLVHYRRHFATHNRSRHTMRNRMERVASGEEILAALNRAPVVLPKRRRYVIETMGSHWAHTHPEAQLASARGVIADLASEYLRAFDRVLAGRSAHMFNMVVMRSDVLDAYCSWLFPIMFALVDRHGRQDYSAFAARYPGRISEFLLDTWLIKEGVSYVEFPVVSPEPIDWVAKGRGFLAAKFLGKKYGVSF